jgi:hypothetical protein
LDRCWNRKETKSWWNSNTVYAWYSTIRRSH